MLNSDNRNSIVLEEEFQNMKVLFFFFFIRNCSKLEMFVFSVNESKNLKILYFLKYCN